MAKRICQSGPNTLLVSDEPAGRGDLLFGEVAVSPSAQFMIECGLQVRSAEASAKPDPFLDLTTDEIECVLLRRRLEQARAEKVISTWGFDHGYENVCVYVRQQRGIAPVKFTCATEREALQAAAEYADGLRKPALPTVESMSIPHRLAELGKRGYLLKPCPTRPDDTIALYRGNEYMRFGMPYKWSDDRITCEFLNEARRLDEGAAPQQ